MTHAAARVIHIAHESRNEVDMQVKHRLPCGSPAIDADVVAVGPMTLVNERFCGI
jgi:hypothetical protein